MIGDVAARAGRPVVITGRSYDLGHAVSGVQFSLNEGASWTTYPFENTNDYQPVDWSFEFQPPRVGEYRLWVRARRVPKPRSPLFGQRRRACALYLWGRGVVW